MARVYIGTTKKIAEAPIQIKKSGLFQSDKWGIWDDTKQDYVEVDFNYDKGSHVPYVAADGYWYAYKSSSWRSTGIKSNTLIQLSSPVVNAYIRTKHIFGGPAGGEASSVKYNFTIKSTLMGSQSQGANAEAYYMFENIGESEVTITAYLESEISWWDSEHLMTDYSSATDFETFTLAPGQSYTTKDLQANADGDWVPSNAYSPSTRMYYIVHDNGNIRRSIGGTVTGTIVYY